MSNESMSPVAFRKLLAGLGAVSIIACGMPVDPVSAPEPVATKARAGDSRHAALSVDTLSGVVSVSSCSLVGPEGYSLSLSGSSSTSSGGNETLQCRGSVSPKPPQPEFYAGFPCYLPQTGDWTSRSSLTLRTSGGAILKCQRK